MYSHENPEDRVLIVQMNSELRHAQLELLSAHCATHQLRLHYASGDLARFGRHDVLRKSAEAASALNEFYSSLQKHASELQPAKPQPAPNPAPTDEQVAQAINWLSSCLRKGRERYRPQSQPLSNQHAAILSPYFPEALLKRIRIVELDGARVPTPEFLSKVRAMGFENLPDVPHMESLTFVDVVVFNERLTERALFHSLVHSVQIQAVGLERYAELWVRGFLKTRAHFTVPLEVHAFSLASRFAQTVPEKFSVEDEVLRWAADDRY
jgi:hypothetical protein